MTDRHPMGLDYYPERTAQACEPVKLSLSAVPFPTDAPLPVKAIQQAHEASRRQSAMFEACAIASELGRMSRESDDPEPLAALMRHAGTQEHATLQLLKLVGRIGLREWFDNDFVVLPKGQAATVLDGCDSTASVMIMESAIEQANQ